MTWRILLGDVRESLRTLAAGSCRTCVTSPPYWGLRDYGVDGQLGLEPTPDAYVAAMVDVFREVRRVLADDGTVFLNLGDSYFGGGRGGGSFESERPGWREVPCGTSGKAPASYRASAFLKPKDLVGIPWLMAFALRADGWTLRSDIVWSKPNPMPESVTDRCTKSHEYIFMFSKAKWVGEPSRRFADISDEDARWLALFLDTEGNIAVKRVERNGRKWYGAQIAFAGTSRELLSAAQSIIGAGTVLEREGQNAPMFYLQLSNQQASALLHRLYPFLIVKRRQARIAMHLQTLLRHRGGRGADRCRTNAEVAVLESLWLRNKQCNRFGAPDLADVPEPKYGKWVSQSYFYDAAAIAEAALNAGGKAGYAGYSDRAESMGRAPSGNEKPGVFALNGETRNKRSVWHVATQPYPEAHFATYPEALIEPCILAGSALGDTVLDPFCGSGTTGAVAVRHQRNFVGCELNPAYLELARKRIGAVAPLLSQEVA